jgi:DNA-binding CsgD family transcriptional regulator
VIGREAELERIEQVLDRVPSGLVGIALEGNPGIGKTTLWWEAIASARERGYRVMMTAPAEPDASLAFASLGDLLEDVPRQILVDLPDPQRHALAVALLAEGDADVSPDPRAVPRAVVSVLRALSADGPLVVAIDDEQWLDRASARVLAFVVPRMRTELVGLVLTRRPPTNGSLWSELEHDVGPDALSLLEVEPLDPMAIDSLLTARLKRRIPRRLLQRIHAASGGNPLYALAIARELQSRPDHGPDPPIPGTLTDVVARRLAHLDDRTRDVLLAAAAASHATVALLGAVIPDFTLGDLDRAIDTGVIEIEGDRVRFTHPLLASTLYSLAPAAGRRDVHRRLAAVIDDEEQRAQHLARAAEAPDGEVAGALQWAAAAAARRGAPEIAAELLEDAARLTPVGEVQARQSRLLAAAELYLTGGDGDRARDLLRSLLPAVPNGPLRAQALFQLANTGGDNWDATAALLDEALAESADDYRLRAQIKVTLAAISSNRGEFAAGLTHSHAAVEDARRAGDRRLLARATSEEAVAEFFAGRRVDHDALGEAVELGGSAPTGTRGSPAGIQADLLFWSDDHDRGRPALKRAIELAKERGEQYDTGGLLLSLALLELFAGNFELAEHHRRAAADEVGDRDAELDLWLASIAAIFVAARGQLEHARAAAHEALEMAERLHDPLIGALPVAVLASIALWTGAPAEAHELLHPVRESLTATGFGFLGSLSLPLWSCDAEALTACGRLDEAQELIGDLLGRSRTAENPNAIAIAERCRGLLFAARGEIPGAIEAMDAALAAHAHRMLRPELARTLLEKGAIQRRAKQKRAAKHTLEQSLTLFEEIGAQMWTSRARDELSRIGLRRATQSQGLTAAQTRVADLAAAGMSNREIASTLYMSTRSVESHLTKVYRELGLRSRSQLATALAATGDSQPDTENAAGHPA